MPNNSFKLKVSLVVWLAFTLLSSSCNKNAKSYKKALVESEIHISELSNKVYLFGPSLDSTTLQLQTGCDCCTSNLAFLRDSTFIYVSYCLEGDDYSKGKYSVQGKEISLHFDPLRVTQSFGFIADTSYKVSKVPPSTSVVKITSYKAKPVLVYEVDGVKEFGLEEASVSLDEFVKGLRADSLWQKLYSPSLN
jgi:hypothetical protein